MAALPVLRLTEQSSAAPLRVAAPSRDAVPDRGLFSPIPPPAVQHLPTRQHPRPKPGISAPRRQRPPGKPAFTPLQPGLCLQTTGNDTICGTASGVPQLAGVNYPTTNGAANQFLQTNGSGTATWASPIFAYTGGSANAGVAQASTSYMWTGVSAGNEAAVDVSSVRHP